MAKEDNPLSSGVLSRRTVLRGLAGIMTTGCSPWLLGCRTNSTSSAPAAGFKITKTPPRELTSLNMLCWTDNALDEFVQPFEQQYGVKINRTYFEGNANAFEKMKLGGRDTFDIVQSDALWPQEYAKAGLVDALDPADYPDAYPYLYDCFKQPDYQVLSGKWYAFPNCWDAVGIGYRTDKVVPAPTGFQSLWDDKYRGRVAFPIVEDNTIQVAGLYLGFDDIYCLTDQQLNDCFSALQRLKLNARKLYTDLTEIEQLFAKDEAWIGLVVISWVIRKLKREKLPVEFVVPARTQGWVDNYMISSGSRRKEMAKFFINWYTSPISQINFIKVSGKRTCQAGVRQFLSADEIAFYGMEDPAPIVSRALLYRPTCNPGAYADILARLRV